MSHAEVPPSPETMHLIGGKKRFVGGMLGMWNKYQRENKGETYAAQALIVDPVARMRPDTRVRAIEAGHARWQKDHHPEAWELLTKGWNGKPRESHIDPATTVALTKHQAMKRHKRARQARGRSRSTDDRIIGVEDSPYYREVTNIHIQAHSRHIGTLFDLMSQALWLVERSRLYHEEMHILEALAEIEEAAKNQPNPNPNPYCRRQPGTRPELTLTLTPIGGIQASDPRDEHEGHPAPTPPCNRDPICNAAAWGASFGYDSISGGELHEALCGHRGPGASEA